MYPLMLRIIEIVNSCVHNLTWTHFRSLLRVSDEDARVWYMSEAAVRQLNGRMTSMTLTKYEKENIILFNEGEDTAHIQTYNAGVGSVQQEAPQPLPLGKILRPRWRDLCAGQVQTVYPAVITVQRGTQTESKRKRKANWLKSRTE